MKRTKGRLPADVLNALLTAISPSALPGNRKEALRARVLQRVSSEQAAAPELLTRRADAGHWFALTPLVEIKLLRSDAATQSYLLRMQPGAHVAPHEHSADEECLVLEGSAYLGDTLVRAGDYHLARKGTRHGEVRSDTGALLFIRSAPIGAYRA